MKLKNGDLYFPRGNIKDIPNGYHVNPKDPKHYIMERPPCKHRVKVLVNPDCNCGRKAKKEVCDLGKQFDCPNCKEREE